MSNAVAENPPASRVGDIMERAVQGDLGGFTPAERAAYVVRLCESLSLNAATAPFQFVTFQKGGGVKLYATKDATEQLRKRDGVSVQIAARELLPDETYVVTARATIPTNPPRSDESVGAVSLTGLKGEARANAVMKAETKAKRRVTLSICGLGFLDESEIDSIPGAVPQLAVQPPAATPAQQANAHPDAAYNRPATPPAAVMVTEAQAKEIDALSADLKVTSQMLCNRLLELFGFNDWRKLTTSQAEELLKKMRDAKAKQGRAK